MSAIEGCRHSGTQLIDRAGFGGLPCQVQLCPRCLHFDGFCQFGRCRVQQSLGVIQTGAYKTVQEEDPLLDMAVKLCHAGARGAYVLRGKRLVGTVTTGEVLKRITGGR